MNDNDISKLIAAGFEYNGTSFKKILGMSMVFTMYYPESGVYNDWYVSYNSNFEESIAFNCSSKVSSAEDVINFARKYQNF